MKKIVYIITFSLLALFSAAAQHNRVDGLRPDAPELAKPGTYSVGVRTLHLSHKNQIDAVNVKDGETLPYYDRPITIEVWYPSNTKESGGTYENVILRDGVSTATLYGSAVRNAEPVVSDDAFPLIIISHGYPGNRFLMAHFGENLASKGYITVAIDHTDSMYNDAGPFPSTLLNRALDQKFVLNELAQFNNQADHFLSGMVDTENTGLIGYSMGGYGAMITAGSGVTKEIAENETVSPNGILKNVMAGSDQHESLIDPRFKAIVAVAPWGMERAFWNDEGLNNIKKPMFFISGSVDDISGYETGTRKLFNMTTNADRYLLTFDNANHNAAAPIPAPIEEWTAVYNDGNSVGFTQYSDPVWNNLRMNNIADHFVTAFFGKILKTEDEMSAYLNLSPNANDGKDETTWTGFLPRTAKGLRLEYLPKAKK